MNKTYHIVEESDSRGLADFLVKYGQSMSLSIGDGPSIPAGGEDMPQFGMSAALKR